MKVRIGIDVGGTFTDAVAIDNESFEFIGSTKIPTTHSAKEGVAAGIIQVLQDIMQKYRIKPEDVSFIAHGTTQATNALLEGDVAKVGIITLGQGLQGMKSKSDTNLGDIELSKGKYLNSENGYVDTKENMDEQIQIAIQELLAEGCTSIVAAEAFSVDDASNENKVIDFCAKQGIPATATSDISKLYGLKVRTRTAVINASIMPKMLEAATMTNDSIHKADIQNPLMVMRCDGGVMSVDEVQKRPILTILSGPAAGVAGALMYEKLSDGIFFEVGGTSTDISCVKDGKVMIKYAEVGGHSTYLNSLDVRTVGIGGGSMVEMEDGKAINIGPRSAHIAELDYEVYTDADKISHPVLKTIQPKKGDPNYAYVECDYGVCVALTMAGAANIAGYVQEGQYAYGNIEAAKKAWKPLADQMHLTVEECAEKVLSFAAIKNAKVVESLMKDYHMDPRTTLFVGGGGGGTTVVPHLAETMGHEFKIAKNAPVISTIGVALAMVRDMVERVISNPSDEDILAIRHEAVQKAIQNGASPNSVEVSIEVDTQRNLVRAIAIGSTELRSKNRLKAQLSEKELLETVSANLNLPVSHLFISGKTDGLYAIQAHQVEKKLFGFMKTKTTPLRLIDDEGVIRLQKKNAMVLSSQAKDWSSVLNHILEELTEYNDGGSNLPNVYLIIGKRIVDLAGLPEESQIQSLGDLEIKAIPQDQEILVIATKRIDG
ncbi:hydantoinase/oxoprolinase family protein [Bulleidia sp. zg-1006]|uniref:hydantoinase/oxoprolinase family protein n=1 Tax=Bulleidia sp. zg-1006 TaxID=2806552 RepID=UPI0019399BC7|nr:hydantoinase/oxoprolinase family protein [Bulleidia sp. zg-1006]QRG86596.1 hydantoinase/oxoprolinase family protein [Bulleidia sp. zg-1006]